MFYVEFKINYYCIPNFDFRIVLSYSFALQLQLWILLGKSMETSARNVFCDSNFTSSLDLQPQTLLV
jgi:hypothetical protein